MATAPQETGDQQARFKNGLITLKTIHFALLGGAVSFGIVIYVVMGSRMTFDLAVGNPLFLVACAVAAVGIAAASALHRVFFKAGAVPADAAVALQKYQVFVLARAALIEGGVFFSAVVVMLTGNVLPGCVFVVCAVVLALYRPTEREFMDLCKPGRSRWTSF